MLAVALPLLFATCMYGQKNYKLTGKIISATNTPIADAVVSVQDTLNATTKADGEFTFKLRDKSGVISVWAPGLSSRSAIAERKNGSGDHDDFRQSVQTQRASCATLPGR